MSMERHHHALLLPEGDSRLGDHGMARAEVHAEPLADHGEHDLHLHDPEVIADALARPPRDRAPGVARALRRLLGPEALRVETLGIVPESRMAVADERAEQDHGP